MKSGGWDTKMEMKPEVRPNLLLITADDLNYDSVGVYGCPVKGITPNIDQLASEGMRFVHAHVTIAVCQPSRSVWMTGRYPHRNGALGFQPIHEHVPTLTEQLHQAGYFNGIIGKETHLQPKAKFCWDQYVSMMCEENGLGRSPTAYYAHTRQGIEQSVRSEKPFFLMVNAHDPHRPFVRSAQELRQFGHHTDANRYYQAEEVEVPGFLPDIAAVREEVAQYYSSVHRLDETVGEILRALEDSGLAEQTLVMFLSDNGMAFPFSKTNCYLNSTRTPWMVRWPGRVRPGAVDHQHFISGIDLMPTLLDAAGLDQVEGMDGCSFLQLLSGGVQEDRESVFTVFNRTAAHKDYPMRAYQNERFGYIFNGWSDQETVFRNESQSGMTFAAMVEAAANDAAIRERVHFFQYRVKEEFYDFRSDPHALMNLIDAPEYAETIRDMKRGLLNRMRSTGDALTEWFIQEAGVGPEWGK